MGRNARSLVYRFYAKTTDAKSATEHTHPVIAAYRANSICPTNAAPVRAHK